MSESIDRAGRPSRPIGWEPAVYEHKAALIGRAVLDVSRSASLLTRAMLAEYDTYRPDSLVAGIDLYNLEAEACGATLRDLGAESCPEIEAPIWDIDSLPSQFPSPESVLRAGRFAMVLEAARATRDQLPARVAIRVPGAGPMSIAAKFVGLEALTMSLACEEDAGTRLLGFASSLARQWASMVRAGGFDLMVFDSAGSPPLLSPDLYRRSLMPLHRQLFCDLQTSGQLCRPLVMGGNGTAIASDQCATLANYLVCDYPANLPDFAAQCPAETTVRRNMNPAIFEEGTSFESVASTTRREIAFLREAGFHAILGTGILPYRTDPERVRACRERVLADTSTGHRQTPAPTSSRRERSR